jgi:hypothetical protein
VWARSWLWPDEGVGRGGLQEQGRVAIRLEHGRELVLAKGVMVAVVWEILGMVEAQAWAAGVGCRSRRSATLVRIW